MILTIFFYQNKILKIKKKLWFYFYILYLIKIILIYNKWRYFDNFFIYILTLKKFNKNSKIIY